MSRAISGTPILPGPPLAAVRALAKEAWQPAPRLAAALRCSDGSALGANLGPARASLRRTIGDAGGSLSPAPLGLASACGAAAALAAGRSRARRERRHTKRRHGLRARTRVCLAATAEEEEEEEWERPSDEFMRELFDEVAGGTDAITFDQALRLEGMDEILEEEAVSLEELEEMWGVPGNKLDFDGFAEWYCEVLQMYDEFVDKDAIAPPRELMLVDDEVSEEGRRRNYTDEELIVDAPVSEEELIDVATGAQEERIKAIAAASQAKQSNKRDNIEITRMFREQCDKGNLLSFDGLKQISEFAMLLKEGEIGEDELQEMWDQTPKKGDSIDVLAFRDLLAKVDSLFEFLDDEEEKDDEPAVKTDGKTIKEELLKLIEKYGSEEEEPCGVKGNVDTDEPVLQLTGALEEVRRNELDPEDLDLSRILGNWDLMYGTSAKFRRYGTILNTTVPKTIGGTKFDGLVISIASMPGLDEATSGEVDMEELLIPENEESGKEFGIRCKGTWSARLQPNVLTTEDDICVKFNWTNVEHDAEDGEVKELEGEAAFTVHSSQMGRAFSYSYLVYVDEDLLILRNGLLGRGAWIYRRIADEKEEDDKDSA